MHFSRNLSLLVAGLACAFAAHASTVNTPANAIYKPTGKGFGELDTAAMQNGQAGSVNRSGSLKNLTLHTGNPMVASTNHVYLIWYGTAWDSASQSLLNTWASSIGGTPYFNINTTYYDHSNVHVKNSVSYAGSTSVGYTHGTTLSDAGVQAVVNDALASGKLPVDANAVYMVLTDKTVGESSGFCTQYCGWHTNYNYGSTNIKYAFIGDAETQCASACGATSPSVNGLPGADSMASIMSHELEEAVTDPDGNAWYSSYDGYENGDRCAWNWGATSTASNGAKYNQTFGGKNWLIQQNWVIASTQQCLQHYP